ncbi:hypothetical protein CYMTET_56310 [Cymbomonas tetramitiformis]|uniref:Uncharacterized protein n=1 Tax=Cymbomonas tetramitiformis TaxID=36881 RepID=A0AAE0EM32_9CHLO|nr:hypothetical protein CYMTET_56310 [Cymbomonas tetramitiformis]
MFKLMFASIRAACFWNLVASGNRNMNLRLDKLELSLSTLTKQTVQLQDENQSATISYTQVGDQPCLREEHNVSRKTKLTGTDTHQHTRSTLDPPGHPSRYSWRLESLTALPCACGEIGFQLCRSLVLIFMISQSTYTKTPNAYCYGVP